MALKEYTYIDIDKLKPSIYQSRTDIEDKELAELKESIKTKGLVQPLLVRKYGEHYEIVAGSRRYYASKALGYKELPVILKEMDDQDALVFSIIENLQRQDLNPIEEAKSFKRLMDEFGTSQEDVAQLLSKDRSTISNHLRLLNLPKQIQIALRERKISMSHARTLLSLATEEEQLSLYERILNENLSVRKVEEVVKVKDKTKQMFKTKKKEDPNVKAVEEDLQKILARKVKIKSDGRKGKITIDFYSPDDLERLIRLLMNNS